AERPVGQEVVEGGLLRGTQHGRHVVRHSVERNGEEDRAEAEEVHASGAKSGVHSGEGGRIGNPERGGAGMRGDLDRTARYAVKQAAEEHLAWLLPEVSAELAYDDWLDTETIAFPGEPRRRCDTVARLKHREGASPPWAAVLEVEARPRSTI